ncbi:amino acid ABC transporter, ATP-binding protein [Agrilactobacillus composti DSM 18527 = JCM 14202]|nr:amino acid ABC transporter, ATP-binding protein [Agrilactobacillus composti DSM 18527 = JCM 14202]
MKVMRQLAEEGATMVVITHQMNFARNVANKVVFMADGQVVEAGSPADIFDHPQVPRTQQFLAEILSNV